MPNVFGGQNIYIPGEPPITTMPNVFGGQNIYTPPSFNQPMQPMQPSDSFGGDDSSGDDDN
jgi:hypothetical protein